MLLKSRVRTCFRVSPSQTPSVGSLRTFGQAGLLKDDINLLLNAGMATFLLHVESRIASLLGKVPWGLFISLLVPSFVVTHTLSFYKSWYIPIFVTRTLFFGNSYHPFFMVTRTSVCL